jgi:hypothetical protein
LSKKCWSLSKKMQVSIDVHREAVGLMLTNFRVGDRVEDKETHKRGYVTFVYSELEFKAEVIAVAATKILLFRLIAFSRSYGGTHEC